MVEFLGEGFTGLVDLLMDRLQDVKQGQQVPRVVVLEAASGSGKSRVVREMYRRLCVGQQVTDHSGRGYWPFLDESEERAHRGAEPMPFRKVIGPPLRGFQRGEGTLPEFFWLPVQCDQAPNGSMTPVLELMWPSLRAHTRYLAEAWKEKASAGQQARRAVLESLGAHVEDLTVEASLEVLTRFLDALGVALPGVGLIPKATVGAITTVRDRRRLQRDVAAGGALDPGLTAADQTAEALLRLVHQDLPLIIVVEDAHLMDQGLADLLFLLAKPKTEAPVLIVCTAWPEGSDRAVYEEWLEALAPVDDEDPWVEIIRTDSDRPFPLLTLPERKTIVRSYAPATDCDTAKAIAAHWENPYALLLALTGTFLQDRLHDGAFDIDVTELDESLPRDIERAYLARWDELNPQVRTALMLAAGALPPGDAAVTWPFVIDVIVAAAGRARIVGDDTDVRSHLKEAVHPLAWAVGLDEGYGLAAFREWLLAHIALRAYGDQRYKKAREFVVEVGEEIGQRLKMSQMPDGTFSSGDGSHVALSRWLYNLNPASQSEHTALAALALAENSARSLQFGQVIQLLDVEGRIPALPHPAALRARELLAYALLQTNQVDEAIDAYTSLRDKMESQGTSLRDLAKVRGGLTAALAQAGRTNEALDNQQTLVNDLENDRDTRADLLTARANLATLRGTVEGESKSIPALQDVLADLIEELGESAPETFHTRVNIAVALLDAGEPQEAHKELTEVLAAQREALGDGHPDLLQTRERIAAALSAMGRHAEAAAEMERLQPDQTRVLGAEHRQTLITRANLARVKADPGGVQQVVEDMTRVLGANDMDTWNARVWLAEMLVDTGRAADAVPLWESLVDDKTATLGASHRNVLNTRRSLAQALAMSDRGEEAVEEFRLALRDQVKHLGSADPDVLITRYNYAVALTSVGRGGRAIDELAGLLQDSRKAADLDPEVTRKAKSRLAELRSVYPGHTTPPKPKPGRSKGRR